MLDLLQVALFLTPLGLWWLLAFRRGWFNFLLISFLMPVLSFVLTTLASLAQRKLEKEVERVRFDLHTQRGAMYSPPTPESTEWLNAFIGTFWRLLPPDMFVPIADTIEDVMQQSLPKFVEAVRISDLGQGDNPLRILSMRALPDRPGDKDYPKEEWIDQGTGDILKRQAEERAEGKDADQAGDYVNYEVSFAYQAMPGQGDRLRAKNIHVLIEFFLGAFDWLHIPIPIWIQVEGIAGTVRLRIQFIPEAPFVGDVRRFDLLASG
jgi:Ca2+-dependent lipid-binding protein